MIKYDSLFDILFIDQRIIKIVIALHIRALQTVHLRLFSSHPSKFQYFNREPPSSLHSLNFRFVAPEKQTRVIYDINIEQNLS